MKKNILKVSAITSITFFPLVTFGQNVRDLPGLLERLQDIMRYAAGAVIGIGVLIFFYGVIKFIANAHDQAKRREGINFIIYGIFSFFVITAIWAILRFIGSIFNFNL